MQVEVPGVVTEVGVQLSALTCGRGLIVIVAVWVVPPAEAVTVAEVGLLTEPAVAENVALTEPAGTVTEAGTVRAAPPAAPPGS